MSYLARFSKAYQTGLPTREVKAKDTPQYKTPKTFQTRV